MTIGTQNQENQFSNLIQPIRDLAKNWEVDVASRLEEYLEELADVRISFDGGETSMNFAEAALLIQSSTCVYSKKVEYLYSLVYQALDMINSKRKLQQAPGSNDKDGPEDDDMAGQEEAFLDLDDIEEGQNIDLKDDSDHLTDANMNNLVRTPLALLGVEENEKSQKILLSSSGEVIGSRMDYWMNRCHVDPLSGTMLVNASSMSLTEIGTTGNLLGLTSMHDLNEKSRHKTADPVTDMTKDVNDIPDQDGIEDGGIPLADIDDDDVDDGGMMMNSEASIKDKTVQEKQRYGLRERKIAEKLAVVKPAVDPWKLLDAHNPSEILEKPYKKAKTFKLPDSLSNKKRKRTTVKAKCTVPIDEFVEKAYFSHASKFPKNPLRVPVFEEFENLFWEEYKRRQATIQEKAKKLRNEKRFEELTALEDQLKQQEEEDNLVDAPDFDVGNDVDDDDDDVDIGPVAMDNYNDNVDFSEPPGETIQPMGFDVQSQQTMITQSYEDLVRQHVDLYLDQAQQYVQETDLSRRIKEWEGKIQPILQQEEQHGPFDIHLYGTQILDSFDPDTGKSKLAFQEITNQRQPYEVCRLFLASLQLANNLNVEIGYHSDVESHMDTMTLEFLSRHRHHEDLAEYKAPSIEHRTQTVS